MLIIVLVIVLVLDLDVVERSQDSTTGVCEVNTNGNPMNSHFYRVDRGGREDQKPKVFETQKCRPKLGSLGLPWGRGVAF